MLYGVAPYATLPYGAEVIAPTRSGDPLRDAFRSALAAICTTAGVSWPIKDTLNTTENPDASTIYLELEFPGGVERQFTFGAPGANLHREEGQVTVRVCSPLGGGHDESEFAAAQIRAAFRMRRFPAGDRSVRITSTGAMGSGMNDAGLWVESVALGYEIYNVG